MLGKHKPIEEQVIVITGASSGIGLTTAEMAARKGARVVLSARTGEKLEKIVGRLRADGCDVSSFVADVGHQEDVRALGRFAEQTYGRIDTWVNNAGVSIFGMMEEVDIDDARHLFDTNFWGVVYGSRIATQIMRRGDGGVIINIGSVLSDRALPVQGFYAASKHAVKGFTEALRVELEAEDDGVDIDVCLVKPTSINTPYTSHAKNIMDVEPILPPPIYAPEVVARAILECAVRPRRDVFVGGGAKALTTLAAFAPRMEDKREIRSAIDGQRGEPTPDAPWEGHLWWGSADEEPEKHGNTDKHVMRWSAYTAARLHPVKAAATAALVGLGALFVVGRRSPA